MRVWRILVRAVLALGLALLANGTALALPLTFATRQAFDATVGPHSLLTFDDLPANEVRACLPPQPAVPDPCVLALDNATFVSAIGIPAVQQRPILSIFDFGTSNMIVSNAIAFEHDEFFATVSSRIIGFDLASFIDDREDRFQVRLTELDGTQTNYYVFASLHQPAFFGAVSATGFDEVSFINVPVNGLYSNFGIDNFATQPVPEPPVLVLLSFCSITIPFARRHRRRRS
jgi:hypothetical protein